MGKGTANKEGSSHIDSVPTQNITTKANEYPMDISLQKERQKLSIRRIYAYSLAIVFITTCLGTMALFFLNGFGVTNLPLGALCTLFGGTIAEVGGMIYVVINYAFESSAKEDKEETKEETQEEIEVVLTE